MLVVSNGMAAQNISPVKGPQDHHARCEYSKRQKQNICDLFGF